MFGMVELGRCARLERGSVTQLAWPCCKRSTNPTTTSAVPRNNDLFDYWVPSTT